MAGIIVKNKLEIDTLRAKIEESINVSMLLLKNKLSSNDIDYYSVFFDLKHKKEGNDFLRKSTNKKLNFIEQLNRSFSDIVVCEAAKTLSLIGRIRGIGLKS